MKGHQHPKNDVSLNTSGNDSIQDVIGRTDLSRRRFVGGGVGAGALAAAGGLTLGGFTQTVQAAPVPASLGFAGIGFESVPASLAPVADRVTVPAGYSAQLMVAWGDPIMPGAPAFNPDASQSASDQARQFGAHTDGMHLFPFAGLGGKPVSDRGLLVTNHEYTHEEILYPDGQVGNGYTIAKTRKSQAAHGIAVTEVRRANGKWQVLKNSPYGRRITGNSFVRISGPAAGHPLMRAVQYAITDAASTPTGAMTDGRSCYGTLNNCGHGVTPWGTYLSGEENWNGYFGATGALPTASSGETGKLFNRYGLNANGFGYRWHTTDPRFDLSANPNEPNLFGWVVEVDPQNPRAVPVKRTAMGRFKHEGAWSAVDRAQNVAFYMGDDERNEYIYKFVCAGKFNPGNRAANMNLLDSGTLYVARFNADGTGNWIALLPGTVGVDGVALRDNPNFSGADDAEVLAKILIKTRMAGDAVGATMMDRPEWTGVRPMIGGFDQIEAYCTLTNNNRRGSSATPTSNRTDGSTTAGSARPAVDAANPRANNLYGGVIRWREDGKTVRAMTFTWDLFIQNGDVATAKAPLATNDFKGSIVDDPNGSADYGAPDGIWFDPQGRLWVQTDQQGDAAGDWVNIGSNTMVCVDPNTGMTRRFMTSPPNCEVTGVVTTPDGKTMFVGIQHPGEEATAANPTQFSNWPASQWSHAADGVTPLPGGRPRSAVVVITKDDGGVIGT
jgi:uncharacterized protein